MSLLVNRRMDVEFVFADNSDDPSIMRDFMVGVSDDPRVNFIPPGSQVYSMVDNWERCVEAATGEYICVIGDDDYVDANFIDLLKKTEQKTGLIDVFVWSRFTYNWPDNRRQKCNVCIPLDTVVYEIKREWLYQEFFTWKQHPSTPNCPFAIYHGAVSKKMMDKIKAKFGGRYFEHPTVDFENCCKLLVTAEKFFYSERPFSVLGSCAKSNSAGIGDVEDMRRKHAIFMQEVGRDIDDDPHMKDFPFPSRLGLAASVGLVQNWFKTTYGYKADGWEKNFAEACARSCGAAQSLEHYEMTRAGYAAAFLKWKGGRFRKDFRPRYTEPKDVEMFFGVGHGALFIDEDVGGVQTPAELYKLVQQVISPIDDLQFRLLTDRVSKSAIKVKQSPRRC